MLSPAAPAVWIAPATTPAVVRAAFASLARADQRLLSALLFDGARCADLAVTLGVAAADVRARAGAAMLALHRSLSPHAALSGGAIATMLSLRALDVLDADETALIDALLATPSGLQRRYAEYCDLAGELCRIARHVAPPAGLLARLAHAIAAIDDDTVN